MPAVERPRPTATLAQRARLALAATVLGLALVELGLRAVGAAPPAVPGLADDDRLRVTNRVNALGLREDWDAVPPRRPGELRVAVLGDSFVYGESVERDEALPAQLETALAAHRGGAPVRVFNLGVCDNGTAQEAARYRALQPALQPDVLVLVAYLNDFTRTNPAYALRDIYEPGVERSWAARHSYLVGHLAARWRLRRARERTIAWYRASVLAGMPAEFAPAGAEIVALRDFAEARGARFVVAFFPWLYDLDAYPLDALHAHLGAFARAHGIALVDLLEVFRGHGDEALRVSPANEHPNPRAHRMAAEAIARFLANVSSGTAATPAPGSAAPAR